jgi:magnesium-transporting ATPase (P-type)
LIDVKGAVERILDRCTHVGFGGNKIPLTTADRKNIIRQMDELASEGLRVLCLAAKHIPYTELNNIKSIPRDELENGCCVLGLAGI